MITKLHALMEEATPGPFIVDVDRRRYMIRTRAIPTGRGEPIARSIERQHDAHLIASALNELPGLLERLKRAEKYMQHLPGCDRRESLSGKPVCTCGLDAARSAP